MRITNPHIKMIAYGNEIMVECNPDNQWSLFMLAICSNNLANAQKLLRESNCPYQELPTKYRELCSNLAELYHGAPIETLLLKSP